MSMHILKPLALSAMVATAALTAPTAARAGDADEILAGALIGATAGIILGGIAADPHRHSRSYVYDDPPRYRHYRRSRPVSETHIYIGEVEDHDDVDVEVYEVPVYTHRERRYHRNHRQASYRAPRAWTRAWYRYCSNRYRSFDPGDGTFQPYRGPRRLCR